jgi:hypothetical protein
MPECTRQESLVSQALITRCGIQVGDQVQPPAFLFALDTTPANDKVDSNFIITRKNICGQRNTEDLSCVKHLALAGCINLQLHGK